MSRGGVGRSWGNTLALLACAVIAGGCAGDGSGGGSAGYSYGAYYGGMGGYDALYYDGPIYVGPPDAPPSSGAKPPSEGRPPPGGARPSHPIARPMPPPRPTPRAGARGR